MSASLFIIIPRVGAGAGVVQFGEIQFGFAAAALSGHSVSHNSAAARRRRRRRAGLSLSRLIEQQHIARLRSRPFRLIRCRRRRRRWAAR